MSVTYTVKSKQNQQVQVCYEVFQLNDEKIRSWNVTETYKTGVGSVDTKEQLPHADDTECLTVPNEVTLLSGLINVSFVYDATITDHEKQVIEWSWEKHRSDWLEDSDEWCLEEKIMVIPGPFEVNEVDSLTNHVLKYDLYLEQRIFS